MKEIKELACFAEREACNALEYAKLAAFYKDSNTRLSTLYNNMANTEMQHSNKAIAEAESTIKQVETRSVDIPSFMKKRFDELHEEALRHLAEAKSYLSLC